MKTGTRPGISGSGRAGLGRAAAALCALALLSGGCTASQKSVALDADKRHEWIGRRFADVVDATDKAFGESRIEDREEIVRAKVGVKAKVREGEKTDWSVPANFRIPLPALERRANIFLDFSADPDTSNLSDLNAVADSGESSFSATVLSKLSETFDLGATLGIQGGPDIGPEVFVRYDEKWLPWAAFAEQRFFWRTDDHWGGRTMFNGDYRLPDGSSFLRWANKADYYQEIQGANLKSGLIYRRMFLWNTALSLETGVEWNPHDGNPKESEPTSMEDDDDQLYARARVIGRVWKPWIEWEILPAYYHRYQHEDKSVWGIDVRVSLIYESLLRGE